MLDNKQKHFAYWTEKHFIPKCRLWQTKCMTIKYVFDHNQSIHDVTEYVFYNDQSNQENVLKKRKGLSNQQYSN